MADPLKLAEPLKESLANAFNAPMKIDAEIYHMMDKRDEKLIQDEVLHGSMAGIFVYDFDIKGSNVSGISITPTSFRSARWWLIRAGSPSCRK